jgi:adenylate cyclase
MESLAVYIPMDRRQAMARGEDLPDRTSGAALSADISGFTPLTEALVRELGRRRGADELTRQLNRVYEALIGEVHRYGGSVIGFSGDAITCWFDDQPVGLSPAAERADLRAAACACAMQAAMGQFAKVETPSGTTLSLAIKVAVVLGPVRRFRVGDPQIQYIDVLAGATLDRMAAAEHQAEKGEIVLGPEVITQLGNRVEAAEWRGEAGSDQRFALVTGLNQSVEATPWKSLPHVDQTERGSLTKDQIRPWLLPVVNQRLRAEPGGFLAEIRPAVALFLKFAGLDYDQDDAAGEKLDTYIRWVQNVLADCEGNLIQLTIGDKGSYLYAAFGAPLAHDDDPARALAAAVELRSPPAEIDALRIRGVQIGISQGRMRTGAYGGPMRRTYGVLGDEVNLAARLMGKAKPGQILVSQRIANAVAQCYHLDAMGLIKLKGKQVPLSVWLVLDRRLPSSLPGMVTHFAAPLVGRADELAQLEGTLAAAMVGQEQFVRLEGRAGVGKSHLVAEFVERAIRRGVRVALGTCESISRDTAYHPWRQIFRALFVLIDEPSESPVPLPVISNTRAAEQHRASLNKDSPITRQITQVEMIVKDMNPDWLIRLPLLGDLLNLPIPDNPTTAALDSRLRQESLFALALELLQSWARAQPLILLVEDAHWMDEASLRLTLAMSRAIANVPLLVVLVYRPFARRDEPLWAELSQLLYFHHLELGELSLQGVAALVTNRLGSRPSTLALSLIQALAQGNPFFAEELVDALRESGDLSLGDDGTWTLSEALYNTLREANCLVRETLSGEWRLVPAAQLTDVDLGIPDSIHGAVLARIDHLPEMQKLTLKVASVIGSNFELDVLAQSHPVHPGQEVLLEQIRGLEGRDLIRRETPLPQPTYAFKHNITQEVTYETLLQRQQRELHRAVGQALEDLQPEAVERLAYHYSRGAVCDKALIYLDKAARKAQRNYANQTALNYYNQALALEERWEWLRGKLEVLHILGQREDERATLSRMEGVPDVPAFDSAYRWGHYYEAVGEYSQSRDAIEQAMETCRKEGDIVGQARCLARLGSVARRQGDLDGAKDWYQRALHTLRDEDAHLDTKIQALNGLGFVHRQKSDYGEARECYHQALALSRVSGNRLEEAQALNDLGITAFYQCDFPEARTCHQQALEIRRTIGDRAGEGASLGNLALVTRDAGDYGQAQDYLSEALTIQQAVGNRYDEANVWNDIGVIHLLVGDLPEAQACFERALGLRQEIGTTSGQAFFLGNLALVVRDQGDLAQAEKLLTEGLTLVQDQDNKFLVSLFCSHLASVSLMAGRLEQALERADTSLAIRRELDLQLWATADLTTLASAYLALGDMPKALDHARQALVILDECDGEGAEYPHRDYFVCYQVFATDGQAEAARAALASAYRLVMTQAEKIIDPALRQSFLEKVEINRQIVEEYEKKVKSEE